MGRCLVGVVLVGTAAGICGAAHAETQLQQTLTATAAVPAVRAESLRLCADGDCTVVPSAPTAARQLQLVLKHAGTAHDRAPGVVVVTGKPLPAGASACAGHLGVAISVGRSGQDGAVVSLEVAVDGAFVTAQTWPRTDKRRPASVIVCLPAA